MNRRSLFLKHIDGARHAGVEIGALNRPTLTRNDVDVRYIDHLDTPGLREKYRNDPAIDTSRIVDVAYVWQGGPLAEIVGAGTRFDFFAASHVIEHVPNPIRWLNEIHGVLKPGGRVLLVVPDKRFTFDIRRRCTAVSELVDAFFADRSRPAFGQIYDQFAEAAQVNVAAAWRGVDMTATAPAVDGHGPLLALDMCRRAQTGGAYVDVHCSVFTPYSFIALLRQLATLGPEFLLPFKLIDFVATPPDDTEFFVALEAIEATPVEAFTNEVAQRLARAAGYAGTFGAGGFAAALGDDEGLRQRHAALMQSWADERGSGKWKTIREAIMASLPDLDPAICHAHPGGPGYKIAQGAQGAPGWGAQGWSRWVRRVRRLIGQ
jgi:SAM-dependent methyltransferase